MYLTQSELVEKLKVEGFTNAQPHIIRYGITRGSIDKPECRGGNFVYQGKHLNQVRSYLKTYPDQVGSLRSGRVTHDCGTSPFGRGHQN